MKSFNYLGVKFDENIHFKYCIKTRSEAASRALDGIVLKCKQYSDVGYNIHFHLFDYFVVPVSVYCATRCRKVHCATKCSEKMV